MKYLKLRKKEAERKAWLKQIDDAQNRIDVLLDRKAEYQLQINNFEVEIGPLKYISALIYGDEALDFLDTAVRGVILILVFVFDPLAVLLIIAANMSLVEESEKRKRAAARKRKALEKKNEGKIKTTVTEEDNGMRKVVKEQNGVSMSYYE